MKAFMDKDFLLSSETSQKLFHEYAENMPIVDYHCHINPQEIAEDRKFENITQVWLGGDHYKWRQMRSNGVDEYYITGGANDREKFQKWAETLDVYKRQRPNSKAFSAPICARIPCRHPEAKESPPPTRSTM